MVSVGVDRDGDYLEAIFEDAPAALEEVSDDVFERRTPDGRVVGFAVFNVSKHDRVALRLPLAMTAISAVSRSMAKHPRVRLVIACRTCVETFMFSIYFGQNAIWNDRHGAKMAR